MVNGFATPIINPNISQYTLQNIQQNSQIQAIFTRQYSLLSSSDTNGTIQPIGTIYVLKGGSQTYSITSKTGYQIDSILVDGISQSLSNSITLNNIQSNRTIRVRFKKRSFTITNEAYNIVGGVVSPNINSQLVNYGDSIIYTVVPAVGYYTDSVIVNGVSQNNKTSYVFRNVQENQRINARFSRIRDTVFSRVVSTGLGNDSIQVRIGSGVKNNIRLIDTAIVYYDSSIVYTIQPSISNKVDSVIIDGVNMGSNMAYTLSNVQQNRRIWVYISKKAYSINISSNISGGLSKIGNNLVSYGDSINTTILPIVGKYYLDSLVIDTLVVDSANLYYSNYTFKNVRETHLIRAVYSLQVIDTVYSALQGVSIAGVGSVNNVLKKVVIKRSANPLLTRLSKMSFNLLGTDTLPNISAIKLWFTGNMDTFIMQNQVGSSIINPNSNKQVFDSINQALSVGNNYFWISYNVAGTAKIGGKINYTIDTIFTDNYLQPRVVLNNPVTNTYSVIQGLYCASNSSFSSNEKIYRVQLGTLNNASGCGVEPYNASSIGNQFTDYTSITPPVLVKGVSYPISLTGGTCNGVQNIARFGVYIDWNQNGYFEEADLMYSSAGDSSTLQGKTYMGNITVPATSQTGAVRMRVIYIQGNSLPANACGVYGYGKTEDYNLIVQPNQLQSITSIQDSTVISKNTIIYKSTNMVPVLKLPLTYIGVGKNTLDKLSFIYTGSNIADINQALLYKGSSTSYSKLISSKLVGGNTNIEFTNLQDTLLNSLNGGNNDTSYYWLVYSLNSPVKSGDTIDSRLNYATILGVNYTPAITDPVGHIVVYKYANYISTMLGQIDSISVEQGKTYRLLKLNIRIDSSGIPLSVNKISLNTNYSSNAARDILNDSIYYVGSRDSFYINNNSVRGKISLLNGNNYFYVQTKLSNTAVSNAFIDLGIDSIVLEDTGTKKYIPSIVNPTGKNKILNGYCIGNLSPKDTVTKTMYVNLNGVINNRDLCGGSDTLDYTRSQPTITVLKGEILPINFYTNLCQSVAKQGVSTLVLIDWNNNGSFLDAGDSVYGNYDSISSNKPHNFNVLVPCWANSGVTRIRILQSISKQLTVQNQCSNYVGTMQDYTLQILDNPVQVSIVERQQTGSYAVGSNNNVIMQIPIAVRGCGLVWIDSLKGRPIGSTNPIIINTVKLYSSNKNSFFSTNKLLSTKSTSNLGLPANPNISFTLGGVNDTIRSVYKNTSAALDTTYYWITFDNANTGTDGLKLDVKVDSIYLSGSAKVPNYVDTVGYVTLRTSPATYISAAVKQIDTGYIYSGTEKNGMLQLTITTSASGYTIPVSKIGINKKGGTNQNDITKTQIWYTGAVDTFKTNNEYVLGNSINLLNGVNYFWVSYDIASTAAINNKIDGSIDTIVVAGVNYIPNSYDTAGYRLVVPSYCVPQVVSGENEEITRVQIGDFVNTSTCATVLSSTGSISNKYSNYTGIGGINVKLGSTNWVKYTASTCGSWSSNDTIQGYVDWNNNGSFADAGDLVYKSSMNNVVDSFILNVPCNVNLGNKRFRILLYNGANSSVVNGCGSFSFGETEDYTINIAKSDTLFNLSNQAINVATAQGVINQPLIKIPVTLMRCVSPAVSKMSFTLLNTNVQNILRAKLYTTGKSTNFDTAYLLASTTNFSNNRVIFSGVNDTIIGVVSTINDTVYYWLSVDISPTANLNDSITGILDSATITNKTVVPDISIPSSVKIRNENTYISSSYISATRVNLHPGSAQNLIGSFKINMSSNGVPVTNLSKIYIKLVGNKGNSFRLFYTGGVNNFSNVRYVGGDTNVKNYRQYKSAIK